jgi:two-component system OmpR family sensor kinase
MAMTTGPARLWTAARRLPGRVPLRVKLTSALLTLVAIALTVISIAGISKIRSHLLEDADSQLTALTVQFGPMQHAMNQYLDDPRTSVGTNTAIDWIPAGHQLQRVVIPVTNVVTGFGQNTPDHHVPGPKVPPSTQWLTDHAHQTVTVPAESGTGRWRVLVIPARADISPGSTISGSVVVGVDVTDVYETIGQLVGIDILVSGLSLVGLALLGLALVRSSLRPLTEIERTAEVIAAGDLTRRVPDRDPRTEVGRLGRSLNTMLSQVEMAFRARAESESAARGSEVRMRQFVSDASHELRTPLTAIRGFAEYYRQRGGVQNGQASGGLPREDLDRIMQRVEQESARMGVLVEDLLLLARLDQQRPLENRPVDLLTLAADAVHDARVIAPGRTIQLTVEAGDAPIVLGDDVRLRQVIGNLMSNALIHTPDGTPVEVRIRPGISGSGRAGPPGPAGPAGAYPAGMPGTASPGMPGTVVLEVADRGPGLTPEQAGRVFERFYRADQARTRQAGGAGLGLAIVAALVAAHGGTVGAEPTPGGGATFRITLPLAPGVLSPDGAAGPAGPGAAGPGQTAA